MEKNLPQLANQTVERLRELEYNIDEIVKSIFENGFKDFEKIRTQLTYLSSTVPQIAKDCLEKLDKNTMLGERQKVLNAIQQVLNRFNRHQILQYDLSKKEPFNFSFVELGNALESLSNYTQTKGAERTKSNAKQRKQIAEQIFILLENKGEPIIDHAGKPIKRTEIFKMVFPLWDTTLKIKCPGQASLYNYLKEYISSKKG